MDINREVKGMHQEIEIIGNLGRNPEMRYMPDGTAVTNFSVAVNHVRGTGEERIEETAWFRVSAWRRLAETCNEYLVQGQRVFLKGRLKFNSQTGGPVIFTRQDGTVGSSFEINASYVKFLSKPGEGSDGSPSRQGGQGSQQAGKQEEEYEEDEIPF